MKPRTVRYIDRIVDELDQIEVEYQALLSESSIRPTNLPSNYIGFAHWAWNPSSNALQARRMALLGRLLDFEPRFLLLFPHPTPEIQKRHEKAFEHLSRWLSRGKDDNSLPGTIAAAQSKVKDSVAVLRSGADLLQPETFATHVVVDTNVLLDDPDLAQFTNHLGGRYLVHLLPVVLRELDDHKRAGRNAELRESAKRADRRLKSLRNNGDITTAARVAGDVWAVFEHLEPRTDGLPSWLELDVPDDRFIASTLLLVSRHPSANTVAVTGDLNLQTKLAATGLPFLDPE